MRLQATHFVEVWKGESGQVYAEPVKSIRLLKIYEKAAAMAGFETIAIFKIKMK